ncbi:unnamed protein product [Urochloa decumbens]|uniref:Protein TIFY n=1 Tax=Urochloa decumbens TaxID=240449 RepID=A0ABC9FPA3_9POAL
MEGGGRDVAAGVAAAAALQGLRWSRPCGGGGGEESDGSSGGGLELSLRLRTGDSSTAPPASAAAAMVVAEEERRQAAAAMAEAEARRNMTIFYNGRVCAVDVTEVQAKAIISMANEEMIMAAAADHRRKLCHQRERHHQLQDSASSSGSGAAMARCARAAHVRAAAAAGSSSRQGFVGVTPAPVIDVDAGLSMKRSLQRFLQKRKARTADAVAPPYAGGGRHAQAMRH